MPDGDVLLFCLVVDGHVGRLVDFGWLKYQHLEEQKTGGWSLAHSPALVLAGVGDVCEYREAQAIGGALRGLHDDVHPEVEPLPLGGMVHDLLFKALDQLQVLHHGAQVPERNPRTEILACGANERQQEPANSGGSAFAQQLVEA